MTVNQSIALDLGIFAYYVVGFCIASNENAWRWFFFWPVFAVRELGRDFFEFMKEVTPNRW